MDLVRTGAMTTCTHIMCRAVKERDCCFAILAISRSLYGSRFVPTFCDGCLGSARSRSLLDTTNSCFRAGGQICHHHSFEINHKDFSIYMPILYRFCTFLADLPVFPSSFNFQISLLRVCVPSSILRLYLPYHSYNAS